jgi:hypothetical protein
MSDLLMYVQVANSLVFLVNTLTPLIMPVRVHERSGFAAELQVSSAESLHRRVSDIAMLSEADADHS